MGRQIVGDRLLATPARYRADLDGLRAVAVALVIAYHFLPAAVPAGFVGVDAFFVISGFVVTRSILHAETGNLSKDLIGFWRRRFLRIFPPLALMVGIVAVIAQFIFPPFPLASSNPNARTAVAALFGLSNLYLNRIGLDYVASSDTNLFLHTWSLGVEEQFYVAFALIFIVLLPALKASRYRFAIVAALAAVSLLLCIMAAQTKPDAAYYFLQYRFWEIAMGSLLALRRLAPLPRSAGWIAAAVLALSSLYVSTDGFPLANLLVATSATALLIWSGESRPLAVLTTRPFVQTGLISYALYLWHWPFAVFTKFTIGTGIASIAVALVATVLAAFASYHLVEKRWRGRGNVITAGAFVALFGGLAVAMAGFATVQPGQLFTGSKQNWEHEWRRGDGYAYGGVITVQCMLDDGSAVPRQIPASCAVPGPRQIIVLGDSQAQAAWGMFDDAARSGAIGFSSLVHSGCGLQDRGRPVAASCQLYWDSAPALVRQASRPGDVVFVATAWDAAIGLEPLTLRRLRAIDAAARAKGATLIVQSALPAFKRPGFLCTREWFRHDYSGCDEPVGEYSRRKLRINSGLGQLGVAVWDPQSLLCGLDACQSIANGKPLFRDYIHLSEHGSRSLGRAFLEKIGIAEPGNLPAKAPH